jgi:phage baseplate assembly protein W
MAVVLGNKQIQDLPTFRDYAIGITLPIQITNTAFNQSFTTDAQAKSNLLNLLLTEKGERLMQPNFGNTFRQFVFEPNDESIVDRISDAIRNDVSFWLPYINIQSIDINNNSYNRDTYTINVQLTFKVANNPTLNTVTFNIGGQL